MRGQAPSQKTDPEYRNIDTRETLSEYTITRDNS